jgi:hypothetical protein
VKFPQQGSSELQYLAVSMLTFGRHSTTIGMLGVHGHIVMSQNLVFVFNFWWSLFVHVKARFCFGYIVLVNKNSFLYD